MGIRNGGHQSSPESQARHRAGCVEDLTAARSANSSAYRTAARCMMNANDMDAVGACIAPIQSYMHH
jgi:hypothetical protein